MSKENKKREAKVKPITGEQMIHRVQEWLEIHWEFRYNIVTYECEYTPKHVEDWEPVDDSVLYTEMLKAGFKFTKSDLIEIIKSYRKDKPFHPFREYFANLKWDGVERIDTLAGYIQAKNPARFLTQFKKHLVRSIACSTSDHEMNKHCLVLVHPHQNSGKTSFIKWLCPPTLGKYYTEEFGVTDKDDLVALCENFIINLDELSVLSKKDLNAIKSVFSKTVVKLRLPYDRKRSNLVRRGNFWGSTNSGQFLTDDQNVRWICFEIEGINFDYHNSETGKIDIPIDQVWAEAFKLYNSKFDYRMRALEIIENEQVNEQFKGYTFIEELILKHFDTTDQGGVFMTATEVFEHIVTNEPDKVSSKMNPTWIGRNLKACGFNMVRKRTGENIKRAYQVKVKTPGKNVEGPTLFD